MQLAALSESLDFVADRIQQAAAASGFTAQSKLTGGGGGGSPTRSRFGRGVTGGGGPHSALSETLDMTIARCVRPRFQKNSRVDLSASSRAAVVEER